MEEFKYLTGNLVDQVCAYPQLAEWFSRNQFLISYFGLTKPIDLDSIGHVSNSIEILIKMTNAAHACLNDKNVKDMETRAYNATAAMEAIYLGSFGSLTPEEQATLYISVEGPKRKR
mgnify:CR=1 FL=1